MRWKRLRYRSLPVILMVFLLMGILLFMERSGIRVSESNKKDAYIEDFDLTAKKVQSEPAVSCLVVRDSDDPASEKAMGQYEQILLDMKIGYRAVDASKEELPDFREYKTAVVLVSDLSRLGNSLIEFCDWVEDGGRALFALTIQKNNYSDMIERKLGIISSGYENVMVDSIYPTTDFMIGGGRSFAIMDAYDSAWAVQLDEQAVVYAYTGDEKKVPLIWENSYGKGKFVVYNIGIYEKATRGFFAASYSLLEDVCAYPVINGSAFYIDDFPSPVPGGDGAYVRRDYDMDIESFYMNVWWPDMLKLAEVHGIKYTGVMIENYGDETSDDIVTAENTERFQYFGNMLLHHGGELGFHGYNHQPLSLGNVDYGDVLPYNTWESYQAMKDSISELVSFGNEQFPTADMSVYVPPSNVLSEEGREMLKEEFPQIKVVASNYFGGECVYEQEFEVADDGMIEAPRDISGCILNDYMQMVALSELNMHLINSHFLHPDDLLDEDRGAALGWEKLKNNLSNYMEWLYESAPVIRNLTGSELGGAIQRFSAVTVEKEESESQIKLTLKHFYDEAYLMVRVNEGKAGKVTGGTLEHITGNLYLLHAVDENVTIERTGEN